MNKSLRIVFFGTPEFAVATLNAIIQAKYNVVAVVTSPDKPAGRGQKLIESAVKQYAIAYNIPLLQPEKLKNEDFITTLKNYKADLQIVVAFRMLPQIVWQMPPLGTINLHASLLPQYRGAAPINWAIINGEEKTGVTTFKLQQEIDTGDILLQKQVLINEDTNAEILHNKLMLTGAELMVETIAQLQNNAITPQPQAKLLNATIKHAPKLFKDNTIINWRTSAEHIHNLVKGLSPYPTAHTILINDKNETIPLKIFKTSIVESTTPHQNTSINTDGKTYFYIHVKQGIISIIELQAAGKKRMLIQDFLRGFKLSNTCKLS